ncbi:MAG: hypothetical protein P8M78_12010 [Myxococcota bacterium]|nr:hypothetical protein [Myxococcota bacterium]
MSRARGITPPSNVDEALRRSAQHARNAIAEALLASHALLDALALATTGRAASEHADGAEANSRRAGLGSLADRIALLATAVRGRDADLPEDWTHAILEALNQEIHRWEEQSRDDPDARPVLRAFIGLREILWEFGLRDGQRSPHSKTQPGTQSDRSAQGTQRPARVQHIKVEG